MADDGSAPGHDRQLLVGLDTTGVGFLPGRARRTGHVIPDKVAAWVNRRLNPGSRPEPPPPESSSRVVVQCNLLDTEGQAPRAYLARAHWGMAAEAIEVVLRRKGGGWSLYTSRIERFGNFRVKTLPEGHPRHGDGRIQDFSSRKEAEAEVQALERARRRSAGER